MAFRGFLIESKSYLDYKKMPLKTKVWFWSVFPLKWVKFHCYGLCDAWKLRRLKQIAIDRYERESHTKG